MPRGDRHSGMKTARPRSFTRTGRGFAEPSPAAPGHDMSGPACRAQPGLAASRPGKPRQAAPNLACPALPAFAFASGVGLSAYSIELQTQWIVRVAAQCD
jgi:hypothetical protein